MKIILLGAPGVGKGTQAKLICRKFDIPHISTGDIFRTHISEGTVLGRKAESYIHKGELVPDYLTISIIEERLYREDCREGFLLDGFPRNLNQAKELDLLVGAGRQGIDKVIFIDLPRHTIIERISGRRFCTKCGSSFHVKYNPSKQEGICNDCEGALTQRPDDNEKTVLARLTTYYRTIKPLVDYYNARGILYKIQGESAIYDVFMNIYNALEVVKRNAI